MQYKTVQCPLDYYLIRCSEGNNIMDNDSCTMILITQPDSYISWGKALHCSNELNDDQKHITIYISPYG